MPHSSLKMRLKKTCNSRRWIWPVLSMGLPLDVGSSTRLSPSCTQHHLNTPLGMLAVEGRVSPPAADGSPSTHGQHPGLMPYLCGVQAGPWPQRWALGAGGHLRAPKAPVSPCMAPACLLAYSPVSVMSCG